MRSTHGVVVNPVNKYLTNDTGTERYVEAKQQSTVVWHSFSTNCAAVMHSAVITHVATSPPLLQAKPPPAFCCCCFSQLEDDIIAKPDYIQSIKKFAAEQSQEWMILEFSQLGFIGKY